MFLHFKNTRNPFSSISSIKKRIKIQFLYCLKYILSIKLRPDNKMNSYPSHPIFSLRPSSLIESRVIVNITWIIMLWPTHHQFHGSPRLPALSIPHHPPSNTTTVQCYLIKTRILLSLHRFWESTRQGRI